MKSSALQLPLEMQVHVAVRQFTRLRWIPPVIIVVGGFAMQRLFSLQVSMAALVQIAVWIAAYNTYLWWRYRRRVPETISELLRCANLHLFFDYFSITLLMYFTGGLLSPLVWFYSIHIILVGIFFRRNKVIWTTTLVWLAMAAVLVAEFLGWIPHQPIFAEAFPEAEQWVGNPGLLAAVLAGTAALWGTVIWLVTAIIDRVRIAERDERELQVKYKDTLEQVTQLQQQRDLYRRSITHDMRSPIAGAQSLLRVMETEAFGPLTQAQCEGLRRANGRLDQMMQMIQDILTIERSSKMTFTPGPVPLGRLLSRIVEAYKPQMEERGITLEMDVDPDASALGDMDDIATVANNLVSNAVKYNRDGGKVTVTITAGDGIVSLGVSDTGIGIAPKDQEQLFKEFFRAGNAKQHTVHGTGLGLAIVAKLVEQNSGKVQLTSELGRGSVVTAILPQAPAAG